jgi:alkylation response protein AidB-like acyl-CoA dehydrogenase
LAAIAKAHICEIAVNATRAVIEAHGGIGYTWEYPAHLLLKRAMFDRAFMGMPALHRERAATLAGWRGKNERRNDALGKAGVSAGAERAAVGAH